MRSSLFALALIFTNAAAAHVLTFDQGRTQAEVKFSTGPTSLNRAASVAVIELTQSTDARALDLRTPPVVELTMEHGMHHPHGPGGPVDVVPGPRPHEFTVREIYFTMPGEWTCAITLTFADGRTERRAIGIRVP